MMSNEHKSSHPKHSFADEIIHFIKAATFFFVLFFILKMARLFNNDKINELAGLLFSNFIAIHSNIEFGVVNLVVFLYCVFAILRFKIARKIQDVFIAPISNAAFHGLAAVFSIFAALFCVALAEHAWNAVSIASFILCEVYVVVLATLISFATYLANSGMRDLSEKVLELGVGDKLDEVYFITIFGLGGAIAGLMMVVNFWNTF